MKHKLLYLLAFLSVLAAGCIKSSTPAPTQTTPSGTFSGQFLLLHKALGANKIDTQRKANIVLTLNASTGLYTVTGDTATVHAGSYGSYSFAYPYVGFTDKTFPSNGTNTSGLSGKIHLAGAYQYSYNGTDLVIVAGNDTINEYYQLKKSLLTN